MLYRHDESSHVSLDELTVQIRKREVTFHMKAAPLAKSDQEKLWAEIDERIAKLAPISINISRDKTKREMRRWLNANCKGTWCFGFDNLVHLEDIDDAVLAKIFLG